MVNLEAELNGFHALFGMRLRSDVRNIASIAASDDELKESLLAVNDLGSQVMYTFRFDDCEAVFTEYINNDFLEEPDLKIAADDRFTYRMMGYKLLFFTISSRDRENNYSTRDKFLKKFPELFDLGASRQFEEFQKRNLFEVCSRRYMEEMIVAEDIEIASNNYNILWHYFSREREPVLQEIIERNKELTDAMTAMEQQGDMLYAAFRFRHNGQNVMATLSEMTSPYEEGRLLTSDGKALDGERYNTLSITVWSKDRNLNREYTEKLKSYFERFDLRKTKAPRSFIERTMEFLEEHAMFLNEQE
ncbi:hypothetical protein GF371_04330 [Candidatus Woesearchaeota archaeon]|nr:hypothetical protein [Candidatus Woesearchaeota archaeon]